MFMGENFMLSREEYIKKLDENRVEEPYQLPPEWSEPQYKCPKCGGNVRKNLIWKVTVACIPPVSQSYYRCDSCDYNEYLDD